MLLWNERSSGILFRVNPVFAMIEPGKTLDVVVTRKAGPLKTEKLLILTTPVSSHFLICPSKLKACNYSSMEPKQRKHTRTRNSLLHALQFLWWLNSWNKLFLRTLYWSDLNIYFNYSTWMKHAVIPFILKAGSHLHVQVTSRLLTFSTWCSTYPRVHRGPQILGYPRFPEP